MVGWFVDWLVGLHAICLVGLSVAGWFAGRSDGWLIRWSSGCLGVCWFVGRLVGRLVSGWLAFVGLADWLAGR